MTEKSEWNHAIPFGAFIALGVSAMFGFGVMMLTTIGHTAKESFYAGLGSFLITGSVLLVIWAIYREGKKEQW